MLPTNIPHTHYWPWDGDEQKAVCGARITDTDHQLVHALEPTCPSCRTYLDRAEDALEERLAEADLALLSATLDELDLQVTRVYARAGAFGSHRFRRTGGGVRS